MWSIETPRLRLRQLTVADAPFMLALVNDPAWLRYVGDRHVRDLAGARDYIVRGPIAMYERSGHGLWLAERKDDGVALGLCGLIAREGLPDVDIGFALLPEFRRQGYAHEAAEACLEYARNTLGLARVVAITTQDNRASGELLERLGMTFEALVRVPPDESVQLRLFACTFR
jgi:RimJ/RimL family protein N-acetyltransferase